MTKTTLLAGPILIAREATDQEVSVRVVVIVEDDVACPTISVEGGDTVEPRLLYEGFGRRAHGADLVLPARANAAYLVGGERYPVMADLSGDLRLAYVSCNGEEDESPDWPLETRNVMWQRLCEDHDAAPFALLMQGGDQIYADDILFSHPEIEKWEEADPDDKHGFQWTAEMEETAERHLLERYIELYRQPTIAYMLARVPSVMMWDDHDIFDGWGSHPAPKQESAVGRGLFAIARRMFDLFQQGRGEPLSPEGAGIAFTAPGFSVLAPDLRTHRTKDTVMREAGWRWFEEMLDRNRDGRRCLIMSSVPALGPRLSWVEFVIDTFWPGVNKYEDDLRDQWQSRAHRKEWQRFLRIIATEMEEHGQPCTLLSGEIHVATRAEMRLKDGQQLHQLVSSGISHNAPGGGYARMLGTLAYFGEDPLSGYPISIHPPAGQKHRYVSQRNYLRLTRVDRHWSADWVFEEDGVSRTLDLGTDPEPAGRPLAEAANS